MKIICKKRALEGASFLFQVKPLIKKHQTDSYVLRVIEGTPVLGNLIQCHINSLRRKIEMVGGNLKPPPMNGDYLICLKPSSLN